MRCVRTTTIALSSVLLLCGTSSSQSAPDGLSALRPLAGEWLVLDSADGATGLRARYEVLAGGSAVMARLPVGTAEEAVTLFHGDGGLVTATHVGPGARPARLVPTEAPPEGELAFVSMEDGATAGVAGIRIIHLGEDRLRVEWTVRTGEDATETIRHELRRETSLADLAAEVARTRSSLENLQRELDRRLKTEVTVVAGGRAKRRLLETRVFPLDSGWNVSGAPFRLHMHGQTMRFASTYAGDGDTGMTVAHHPFEAGENGLLRFSVMGGHAYIALVAETRAPPRKIGDVREFNEALLAGTYGEIVESVQGERATRPLLVEWDLTRFAGRSMRIYVVDAETNHYGQIAVSEIAIVEDATD